MLRRRPAVAPTSFTAKVAALALRYPLRTLISLALLSLSVFAFIRVREWESIPSSMALLWRAYVWTDTKGLQAAGARRWDGREPRIKLALVLPVTSKGSEESLRARAKEQVLVMAVFLKSLASAVLPGKEGRIDYTVYVGVADDDTLLGEAADWIVETSTSWLFVGLPVQLELVRYPAKQTLTQMYNHLSRAAYRASADYVFNVNDDLTVTFPFAEAMIRPLETSRLAPGFGTSGLAEKWQGLDLKTRCPMYNMVSRAHLAAMNGDLYDEFFPNYGIDTAICHLYGGYDASFYVLEPHLVNHVAVDGSSQVPTRYIPGEYKNRAQYERRSALLRPALNAMLAHYRAKGTFAGFACQRTSPALDVPLVCESF